MKDSCLDFRARLASALSAQPSPATTELAWHEHLLFCSDCRALLDAEEALDDLLRSLPRPSLPPALARRVLVRLQPVRDELELDRLLDGALAAESGGEVSAPPGLAGAVLKGLSGAREQARREQREEAALDALLARVPPPQTPVGLAARMLASLADERAAVDRAVDSSTASPALTVVPLPRRAHSANTERVGESPRAEERRTISMPARSLLVAASLAVLVGGAAWVWSNLGSQPGGGSGDGSLAHSDGAMSPVDGARDGAPRESRLAMGSNDAASNHAVTSTDRSNTDTSNTDASNTERGTPTTPKSTNTGAPVIDLVEPDAELLAQLELLESWDVLNDETLDFELAVIDENTLIGLQSSTSLETDATPASGSSDGAATAPTETGKG